MRDRFWELPLDVLTHPEWEALCDGCGQCCLHKLEDIETGVIYSTRVACRLLDTGTARCRDYAGRQAKVPDCMTLTRETVGTLAWLPESCAYRLRAEGDLLPDWHYLIAGDAEAVRRAGASVAGRVISEDDAGPIEDYVEIDGHVLVDAPDSELADKLAEEVAEDEPADDPAQPELADSKPAGLG